MTRQIRAATAGAAAGGWRHGLVWRWLSEGSAGSPRSGLSVAGSSWRAPFGDRSPCNAQQGVILDDQISRMGEALAGQGGGWSRGGQLSGVAADVPRARWVWLSRASGQRCVSFSSARAGWWQTGGRRSRWQSGGWRDLSVCARSVMHTCRLIAAGGRLLAAALARACDDGRSMGRSGVWALGL